MYLQAYHQAVARRLKSIADGELEIRDIYSLLDWLHNTYTRYVSPGLDLRSFRSFRSADLTT